MTTYQGVIGATLILVLSFLIIFVVFEKLVVGVVFIHQNNLRDADALAISLRLKAAHKQHVIAD